MADDAPLELPALLHLVLLSFNDLDESGLEQFAMAVANDDVHAVEEFLQPQDPDQIIEPRLLPLLCLAADGNLQSAQLLLEAKADVNRPAAHGMTALHVACVGGHVEITELLLQSRADIRARDENADTPLHRECVGSVRCAACTA